jgi:hypothetical protein
MEKQQSMMQEDVLVVQAQLEHILMVSRNVLPNIEDKDEHAYIIALQLVAKNSIRQMSNFSEVTEIAQDDSWQGGKTAQDILARIPKEMWKETFGAQEYLAAHRNRVISQLISGYVQNDEALVNAINNAGNALCQMLVRRNLRERAGKNLLEQINTNHNSNVNIMRQSLACAKKSKLTLESQFQEAFCRAVELKREHSGVLPKLILIHDIDQNLTVNDDHYNYFPHKDLYFRIQRLHCEMNISPAEIRFAVLSIFGASHRDAQKCWYSQLRVVGYVIQNLMFEDARNLFSLTRNHNMDYTVESHFVTGNSAIVAAQLATSLGLVWMALINTLLFWRLLTEIPVRCSSSVTMVILSS